MTLPRPTGMDRAIIVCTFLFLCMFMCPLYQVCHCEQGQMSRHVSLHDRMSNERRPRIVSWSQMFVGYPIAWSVATYLLLLAVDTLTYLL